MPYNFVFLQFLKTLGEPHVSSFNYMVQEGLQQSIDHLLPAEFKLGENVVKISLQVRHINF